MHIHRRRVFAARTALSVFLLALLAACAVRFEPTQDPHLIAELEALERDTRTLFASSDAFAAGTLPAREVRYADLAARAAEIRSRAKARPTPSNVIAERVRAASRSTERQIREVIGHALNGEGGRNRENATAAYMTDYLGVLDRLRDRDRVAPAPGLSPSVVTLGRLALEGALRDALIYERGILSRGR